MTKPMPPPYRPPSQKPVATSQNKSVAKANELQNYKMAYPQVLNILPIYNISILSKKNTPPIQHYDCMYTTCS